MSNVLFGSSSVILNLVEKMIELNITTDGMEKLDKDTPYLYCINHFTRMETFIMPYIFYKLRGFKVRSLADHSVFVGSLGRYMSSLGAVSTKDKNRDEIIIKNLMLNESSWIIYPEGQMVKNKKILKTQDGFEFDVDGERGHVFTGSAVYALKSELEKGRYLKLRSDGLVSELREFEKHYNFEPDKEMSYLNTKIIPVNISYSPIRSGNNSIKDVLDSMINYSSSSLDEELDIESNLLLNSHMHISFADEIDINEYIYSYKKPSMSDQDIIDYGKSKLTTIVMDKVYQNVLISFDHIFALCLQYYKSDSFELSEFKVSMYLVSREILALDIYKLNPSLHEKMFKLINYEKYIAFDDIFSVALKNKVIQKIDKNRYSIDRDELENEYTFHTIRVKNILKVLLNEVFILENLTDIVKSTLNKSIKDIKIDSFFAIYNRDLKRFKNNYHKYYSVLDSKSIEVGKPRVWFNDRYTKGIVVSHGFKSSPLEVKYLCEFFHQNGFNVYAVRLEGHGTLCEDLKDRTYNEWIDSFDRGFSAISAFHSEVYLCGFSTGGLLALLSSTKKDYDFKAIISINTAIALQDIRIKYMVPTVSAISSFLALFDTGLDYVISEPENPHINYKKSYITSVNELGKLIELCNDNLEKVKTPTLIIQGDEDSVVNPQSAKIIYDKISSEIKEISMIKAKNHVILTTDQRFEVFDAIKKFLKL